MTHVSEGRYGKGDPLTRLLPDPPPLRPAAAIQTRVPHPPPFPSYLLSRSPPIAKARIILLERRSADLQRELDRTRMEAAEAARTAERRLAEAEHRAAQLKVRHVWKRE